jgi:threonylcarbamoyladenosine tRNA methylthiotransferase MtaB
MRTFAVYTFGCRVNAAETNQYSQTLINQGFVLNQKNPDLIFVNTCAVTKKGEYESISKIKDLVQKYPHAKIIAAGCANLDKVKNLPNVTLFNNLDKEKLSSLYSSQIKDKFSHTHRYLLKIQSGCTQFCTYCIVPSKRKTLWSLPIDAAVNTVNQAVKDSYNEIIITGVNIDQYQYGLSNLVSSLLKNTSIPLISFGSIPLNCLDDQFLKLIKKYPTRISKFLHLPIQSGSDKILKLMHRPYTKKDILEKFNLLNKIKAPLLQGEVAGGRRGLNFGTDIIVGFPGETETDFQETYDLCQSLGFSKIHVFKYSPRPHTAARELFLNSPKLSKETLKSRSLKIRSLTVQTTLPSHQTPEI